MTRHTRHRSPHARLGLTSQAGAEDVERAHRELVDFLEGAPQGARRWAQGEIAAADAAYAAISNPARARRARRASPLRRILVGIVTLAVSAGVVVVVYSMGGGKSEAESGNGGATAAPSLSPGDEFRVSKLMGKLKAEPNDVATLVQLGDLFFQARDYNSAGGWMKRAVAIEPDERRRRAWRSARRSSTSATSPTPGATGCASSRPTRRTSRPTTTSASST